MISEIYRNPKPRVQYYGGNNAQVWHNGVRQHQSSGPPFDTKPTTTAPMVDQPPPQSAPAIGLPAPSGVSRVTHTPLAEAAIRASKIGISTEEWQRRDSIIRKLWSENTKWFFMDDFYPSSKKYYDEIGKCWYKGAVASYREIDHNKWPENDKVLIFSASPCKGGAEFVCNLEFMSKEVPTE